MPLSADLVAKSVEAAVAAIEIYNKPNFSYREEAFSLLMTNSWELLLKARWLAENGEAIESLYEMVKDKSGGEKPKENRSGNPISFGLTYLAAAMVSDEKFGLEKPAQDNLLALIEIRDNAAHLINKDMYLARRVQEIGTASLQNYLLLASEWFKVDLSQYNFFLMPISFFHGFETAEPATRADYPIQIQKLLTYLDAREATDIADAGDQRVALRIETKLVRGKDSASVEFRYTDDPTAPAIAIRQEDILKNFPFTYRTLTAALGKRYSDFMENAQYHKIRRALDQERKFCFPHPLNPTKPEGACQRLYNANVFQEFDKHYTRRKK
jgi:translation elongation factor EF-1beta